MFWVMEDTQGYIDKLEEIHILRLHNTPDGEIKLFGDIPAISPSANTDQYSLHWSVLSQQEYPPLLN